MGGGIETFELTEEESDGVSVSAIIFADLTENALADGEVGAIIFGSNPEAQHISPALIHDILGWNDIAQALAHGLAFFVEGKAMGEDGFIGGGAASGHGDEKTGVEPSAVLVGAFEVELRRGVEFGAIFKNGNVGGAAIEPDIEDIRFFFDGTVGGIGMGEVFGKKIFDGPGPPGVGTFFGGELDQFFDNGRIEDAFARGFADHSRDGYAPSALAGETPVGPIADHVRDPAASPFWDPLDLIFDGIDGPGSDRGFAFVHGEEPLLGGSEDDRFVAAPAVGVTMFVEAMMEQEIVLIEEADDGFIGLTNGHASHELELVGESSGGINRNDGFEASAPSFTNVTSANLEVFDTVAGGGMDGTGSLFEGDMVAENNEAGPVGLNGVAQAKKFQFAAEHRMENQGLGKLAGLDEGIDELCGYDEIFFGGFGFSPNSQGHILKIRMEAYGDIRRESPGGCGPDDNGGIDQRA